MTAFRRSAALLISSLLLAEDRNTWDCVLPEPAAELERADAVFVCEALDLSCPKPRVVTYDDGRQESVIGDEDVCRCRVRVTHAWKGEPGDTTHVYAARQMGPQAADAEPELVALLETPVEGHDDEFFHRRVLDVMERLGIDGRENAWKRHRRGPFAGE